ncbi:hypothetical protein RRG08_019755 [Elysia crispata]|uniref:Uncharacterized protein n=1 Tax=Elysia crispata TaxID=231223 RepID=A0AAE1CTT6_9GAST|nr:hypothetical protein RRG08_019755 [Elysia crispata]
MFTGQRFYLGNLDSEKISEVPSTLGDTPPLLLHENPTPSLLGNVILPELQEKRLLINCPKSALTRIHTGPNQKIIEMSDSAVAGKPSLMSRGLQHPPKFLHQNLRGQLEINGFLSPSDTKRLHKR